MANEQNKQHGEQGQGERQPGAMERPGGSERGLGTRHYQDPFAAFDALFERLQQNLFGTSLLNALMPTRGDEGGGGGIRTGGTEKGSRPVKLWIGGPPPPGEGLGELEGSGKSGTVMGSSPPPSTEKSTKPARSTPTTLPPIVTVRRSRSDSAIDHPSVTRLSVGPGSEPGPALTSLVYNVIVAANPRPDPSIGVRLTDSTVAARGSVSISCRYFTMAK